MKILRLSPPIGLGDMILSRQVLESRKNEFDKIEVSLPLNITRVYHEENYNEYIDFATKFCNILYENDERFRFLPQANFPFVDQISLQKHGFIYDKICKTITNKLCKGIALDIGDYIVINCKVRYLRTDEFENISNELYNILNLLSQKYKIVILGERFIEPHYEYNNFHKGHIYTIYDGLINNIKNNVVDLTVPAIGITTPDISKIQQDCLIMNQAKFCITIGIGGAYVLTLASANKIIGYRRQADDFGDTCMLDKIENDINYNIYTDYNLFFNKLKEELNG
jgi:hypothetical protein